MQVESVTDSATEAFTNFKESSKSFVSDAWINSITALNDWVMENCEPEMEGGVCIVGNGLSHMTSGASGITLALLDLVKRGADPLDDYDGSLYERAAQLPQEVKDVVPAAYGLSYLVYARMFYRRFYGPAANQVCLLADGQ